MARVLGVLPDEVAAVRPRQGTDDLRRLPVIARMEAGPKKDIALAEYHYFSGQAEKAMQETEGYLTAADGGIRLSACLIFAYACLSMGRIDHARSALGEIRRTLASGGETDPAARAMEAFVAFAAAVLLLIQMLNRL